MPKSSLQFVPKEKKTTRSKGNPKIADESMLPDLEVPNSHCDIPADQESSRNVSELNSELQTNYGNDMLQMGFLERSQGPSDEPSTTDWHLLEENLTNLYEAVIKLKDLSYYNLRHHAERIHQQMQAGVIAVEETQENLELKAYVARLVSEKSTKVNFGPRTFLFLFQPINFVGQNHFLLRVKLE
jgi:hypothetical protein